MEVIIGLIVVGVIIYFVFFKRNVISEAEMKNYHDHIGEMIYIAAHEDKPVQTTTIPMKAFMAYAKKHRNVHMDMHSVRGNIYHYCTIYASTDEGIKDVFVKFTYTGKTVIVEAKMEE